MQSHHAISGLGGVEGGKEERKEERLYLSSVHVGNAVPTLGLPLHTLHFQPSHYPRQVTRSNSEPSSSETDFYTLVEEITKFCCKRAARRNEGGGAPLMINPPQSPS